jgi:preprotein translocase subunit SecF
MQLFQNTNFDFIRWRWHAIAFSLLVILAGVGLMIARGGLPLGIDFSGGTIIILDFERPTNEEAVRSALQPIEGEKVVQTYGNPSDHQILVRLPQRVAVEQGAALGEDAKAVLSAVEKAGLGPFQVVSTEIVGPAIGADLQRKGIYATVASLVAITLYIAFRFRVSFALGSIIATFHDILMTFAFLVFFNYELSLNIIAAMLTMVGYSVNDMIVIFDRVRENTRLSRREPLEKVINTSINQTLARTVITSGTVFLSVLALYLFGGEVLKGFGFTMLAGTLATTYSGWFIAPSIAIMLSRQRGPARAPASAQAGADARAKTDARAKPDARGKKTGRKARAS